MVHLLFFFDIAKRQKIFVLNNKKTLKKLQKIGFCVNIKNLLAGCCKKNEKKYNVGRKYIYMKISELQYFFLFAAQNK